MADMDGKVGLITKDRFCAPNLLCARGKLEKAMQFGHGPGNFWPIEAGTRKERRAILRTWLLYQNYDKEYEVLSVALTRREKDKPEGGRDRPHLTYRQALNLPNNPANVRFRQEAVKELVANDKLYDYFERTLTDTPMFFQEGYGDKIVVDACMTPERLSGFLENLAALKSLEPQSKALRRTHKWAEDLRKDTMLTELFRKKRKVTDSRIFAVYTERFRTTVYGLLKPGIKPEDVFDFLSPETDSYTINSRGKGGRAITNVRDTVKHKHPRDLGLILTAVGHGRQRMDVLNEISTRIFAVPTYLAYLQLQQIYQGARLHKQMDAEGFNPVFPEIVDESGVFDVKDILPVRMILGQVNCGKDWGWRTERFCPNSFSFGPEHKIIQAEGANNQGKSEAWRTWHLANHLTNAGYSIPTLNGGHVRTSIVPTSHFISCKGNMGHGGSELERAMSGVLGKLEKVHRGDMVIFDEFGDSTNAPTAVEAAKRILPSLVENGNRILVTSHHDALTGYVGKNLSGVSLTPNSKGRGIKRFQLVPAEGVIDFRPGETLDEMALTKDKVRKTIKKTGRSCQKMRTTEDLRNGGRGSSEFPF
jgi:hypothetical protein